MIYIRMRHFLCSRDAYDLGIFPIHYGISYIFTRTKTTEVLGTKLHQIGFHQAPKSKSSKTCLVGRTSKLMVILSVNSTTTNRYYWLGLRDTTVW